MNSSQKIVLKACGILKSFGGNTVLNSVDLQLHEGEVVLLQGRNGSGKTTLLNILSGNLEPDSGEIILANGHTESFRFPRSWWQHQSPFTCFSPERMAQEGIGRSWQDVRLFSSQSLRDNISAATPHQPGENPLIALFTPWKSNRFERENTHRADKLLEKLGLAGRAESSGDKISLGQSKRVAIARAIQAGAKILFLDEPLSGLDHNGVESVIKMLKHLADEHKITLVITEHALNIQKIAGIVTTVWTLSDGQLATSAAEPEQQLGDELRTWLTNLAGKSGTCITMELPNGALLTLARRSTTEKRVMSISNLTVNRGIRQVIGEPLSFDLHEGEIALLEAPNGWGKSSLLDAISGIIAPTTGNISICDIEYSHKPVWSRARAGVLLNRSQCTLFQGLSIHENELLYGVNHAITKSKPTRATSSLSGGEFRRFTFDSALNHPHAKILLLDEPFQAMDTEAELYIRAAIELALKNKSFLITIPRTMV